MLDPARVAYRGVNLSGLQRLAASILRSLPVPLSIGLTGTLGAGKTTLVQALARAARIDPAEVTSPTFTLVQSYPGRRGSKPLTIHHLDAYRVADEDEFWQLGVAELFDDAAAWTIVEWADRVSGVMPPDTVWIELMMGDTADTRDIELTAPSSFSEQLHQM